MEKAGHATFFVKDGVTKAEFRVINSHFLNTHQEKQMAMQPDMILQFAHFLGKYYRNAGIQNPQVRAQVYVTLNGKPSRLLLSEHLNLLTIKDGWSRRGWILD